MANSSLSKDGLTVEVLQAGNGGPKSKSGDTLWMHYRGTFPDGEKFDASYDRNEPFKFKLGVGQVIRGWEEGMQDMEVGEKRKLTCRHDFAYGERGFPGAIPPKATLVFETELLQIGGNSYNGGGAGGREL